MPSLDELELHGLFPGGGEIAALTARLRQAGVPEEQIQVLSPVPLSSGASDRIGLMPLYGITIAAGIVGIGVGIFFAAGTAAMYPLMTGGKPIVGAPIVAIISYETMMLLAIVMTFLAMLIRIKSTQSKISSRDARVDEGRIAVIVRVPILGSITGMVRDIMMEAGALSVQFSMISPARDSADSPVGRAAASVLLPFLMAGIVPGCSQDMQEQPSYQAQEAPRRHSPLESVPRESRRLLPIPADRNQPVAETGATLFRINCVHCHGARGTGDGPVAPFLKERPADLTGEKIRAMSEEAIYRIVTYGKDMMPSFNGELSAGERLEVARFVASLSRTSVAHRQGEEAR